MSLELSLTNNVQTREIITRENFKDWLNKGRKKFGNCRFSGNFTSPDDLSFNDLDLSNTDFTDANLTDANFTNANLSGANLTDANLTGANFTKANFTDAKLIKANLTNANLIKANLTNANLRDTNFEGANLKDANLSGAKLYNAKLYNANLKGANLKGANLKDANLKGANLKGANLDGVSFKDANLDGVSFGGANLVGVKHFSEAKNLGEVKVCGATLDKDAFIVLRKAGITDFSCCTFVGDFDGLSFEYLNLSKVGFIKVNLFNTNLSDANLDGVSFKDANLIGVKYLDKAKNLNKVKVCGATLDKDAFIVLRKAGITDFSHCIFVGDFDGVSFKKLNLSKANFTNAKLTNADFTNADLTNANLKGANLKDANLEGANFEKADLVGLKNLGEAKNLSGVIAVYGATLNKDVFLELYKAKHKNFATCKFVEEGGVKQNDEVNQNCDGNEKLILSGMSFNSANFSGTRYFAGADFRGAKLARANFSAAHLEGANFSRPDCDAVNFRKTCLDGVNFEGAYLEGVNFEGEDLLYADFRGAHLNKTNFRGTDIKGANLVELNDFENALGLKQIKNINYVKIDASAFMNLYKAGHRDFSNCNFEGEVPEKVLVTETMLWNSQYKREVSLFKLAYDTNFDSLLEKTKEYNYLQDMTTILELMKSPNEIVRFKYNPGFYSIEAVDFEKNKKGKVSLKDVTKDYRDELGKLIKKDPCYIRLAQLFELVPKEENSSKNDSDTISDLSDGKEENSSKNDSDTINDLSDGSLQEKVKSIFEKYELEGTKGLQGCIEKLSKQYNKANESYVFNSFTEHCL